jgi:hypothetical protein
VEKTEAMRKKRINNRLMALVLQNLTMADIRLRELSFLEDAKVVREIHDRLRAIYMEQAA